MPRGSAPGERRGGRRKGTPNRTTVLFEKAVILAEVSGEGDAVDFLTRIYRDPKIPLSVRIDCVPLHGGLSSGTPHPLAGYQALVRWQQRRALRQKASLGDRRLGSKS